MQINEWKIYELAVNKDHVTHTYIRVVAKWNSSKVMKVIKGGAFKKIMQLFSELEEVFCGVDTTLWCEGYLIKSAGGITERVISRYVREQRKNYK